MSWTGILALALLLAILAPALVAWRFIRPRNMQIWLPQWIFRKRLPKPYGPTHVLFCFVDHFEPKHGKDGVERQRARVDRRCRDDRAVAGRHRDATGRHRPHGISSPEAKDLAEHRPKTSSQGRN